MAENASHFAPEVFDALLHVVLRNEKLIAEFRRLGVFPDGSWVADGS